jgi:hypothetical protein
MFCHVCSRGKWHLLSAEEWFVLAEPVETDLCESEETERPRRALA